MLYLFIYIKIKNGYKLNGDMYKDLKWHEEFINYCRTIQKSTLSSFHCIEEEYTNLRGGEFTINNTNQEFTLDAKI